MRRPWLPHAYYESIADIPAGCWFNQGKRLVLLDLDNTLIPHGGRRMTPFARLQIQRFQRAGFQVVLLSNAQAHRVKPFAEAMDLPYIALAAKPSARGIHRAATAFNHPLDQIMVIGDQIWTDIVAANRAGVTALLVEPLSRREKWYIRLKRQLEWPIKVSLPCLRNKRRPAPRRLAHRHKLKPLIQQFRPSRQTAAHWKRSLKAPVPKRSWIR